MISLLINRQSTLSRLIILFTLLLWGYFFVYKTLLFSSSIHWSPLVFSLAAILLILFSFIPWYKSEYKGLGIETHFGHMSLIGTYLLLIYLILSFFGIHHISLTIIFSIILLSLNIINFILLKHHFNDNDQTPPAYFAANLYLKDKD
ncbi:hypothetical protein BVY03_02735 [bacterium K02(2017)]|nr:hypothetical protein BVY03_02735 [bacterium K02(2017)]